MNAPVSRIETVAADTPFAARLARGFGYPLRGAALPTCVALALAHYVGLLPAYIGLLASALVWAATWRYAANCMLHTAHGYADPPDVGAEGNDTAGWGLVAIHLLAIGLCMLAALFFPHALWPLLLGFALMLPAIDMSLAFDGNLALALNPLNAWRIIAGFGTAYLIPVAINVLLGVLIVLASAATALLPRLLALPLFALAYGYLIVLAFHLMGAMIHQRHERFGLEPEAQALVAASGQDADAQLLARVEQVGADDPLAAIALLVPRLQDRIAPAALHRAYRQLLQRQGLRDGLLVHGQIWMAGLLAAGEPRRALAVLQECTDLDASFAPDDPANTAALADQAMRLGMPRIALRLCRGYLRLWPRAEQAPRLGLLAGRLLGDTLGQRTEAVVLLGKLAGAWPDHALRGEIDAQLQRFAA